MEKMLCKLELEDESLYFELDRDKHDVLEKWVKDPEDTPGHYIGDKYIEWKDVESYDGYVATEKNKYRRISKAFFTTEISRPAHIYSTLIHSVLATIITMLISREADVGVELIKSLRYWTLISVVMATIGAIINTFVIAPMWERYQESPKLSVDSYIIQVMVLVIGYAIM